MQRRAERRSRLVQLKVVRPYATNDSSTLLQSRQSQVLEERRIFALDAIRADFANRWSTHSRANSQVPATTAMHLASSFTEVTNQVAPLIVAQSAPTSDCLAWWAKSLCAPLMPLCCALAHESPGSQTAESPPLTIQDQRLHFRIINGMLCWRVGKPTECRLIKSTPDRARGFCIREATPILGKRPRQPCLGFRRSLRQVERCPCLSVSQIRLCTEVSRSYSD